MQALATVMRPHAGDLEIVGIDAENGDLREIRRHVGYLPQSFGYYPRYTAREFVEYLAWLKEMPGDAIPARSSARSTGSGSATGPTAG